MQQTKRICDPVPTLDEAATLAALAVARFFGAGDQNAAALVEHFCQSIALAAEEISTGLREVAAALETNNSDR